MYEKCCLCGSIISKSPKEQYPMKTSFGFLCSTCVARGHWERMQNVKTKEQFSKYKLSIKGLL